jgi:hypothetical protein
MGGLCGRPLETLGWIPDWTQEHVPGLESREAVEKGTYRAAFDTGVDARYEMRADCLVIGGMLVDTISRVSMHEFPARDLADPQFPLYPNYFRKCFQTVARLNQDTSHGDLLEVVWRTLTGNRLDDGVEPLEGLNYHTKTLTGMIIDSEHCDFSTYKVPRQGRKRMRQGYSALS